MHDLSWGTKGLEAGGGHGPAKGVGASGGGIKDVVDRQKRMEAMKQKAIQEKEDVDNSFRVFRSGLLMFWLVTNGLWLYVIVQNISSSCYLLGLSYVVAVFNSIRFLGSVVFILFRIARRLCCRHVGSSSGGNRGNFSTQLPPEWQNHYQDRNRQQRGGVKGSSADLVPSTITPSAVDIDPKGHYNHVTTSV